MSKILLTSGYSFEGYKIKEYLGFYSGECALGTGFLSSFGAGLADILGSNSSMYEGKLSRAKSMAISELESKIRACGANAIIGLDVDYTTFTSDIMGVVANGTAVRVEKIPEDEDIDDKQKEQNDIIEFPVMNYYKALSIRPFKLIYDKIKKEIELYIFCYKSTELAAMNVDIIANTIFGTTYEYSDINFVGCYFDKSEVKTEKVRLDISYNRFKTIESFSIKINHFILGGEVFSVNDQFSKASVSVNKIKELRSMYGNDIISDFQENGTNWICMCGIENSENICQWCGRVKGEYSKVKNYDTVNLENFLPQIEQLHNCKEIVEYLLDIESSKDYHFSSEMIEELKQKSSIERLYGNMKDGAIKIIKKYISGDF